MLNKGYVQHNTLGFSGNTYMGKIPGFQAGTPVQYKIIAYDKANNSAVEDKNGEYYIYTVIPEFTATVFLLTLVLSTIVIFIKKNIAKNKKKNKSTQYGAIVAAGRRGSVNALSIINNFFLGHDMLATGLGISGYGTNKGEIKQDKRAIQGARSLGKQVAQLTKAIKPQE